MIKKFFMNRLAEPSTWRGLILLIAGCMGYTLTTGQATALVTIALAIVGGIGAFTPDKIKLPSIPQGTIDPKTGTEKISDASASEDSANKGIDDPSGTGTQSNG